MSGIHAIVLAAGAGARFGGGKLLASYKGRPLIEAALDAALAAPVEGVLVVTGADADSVAAVVAGRQEPRLRLVHAVDHAEGMAASLRAAVAALPADAAGVLVFLGDMPAVPASVFAPLVAALAGGAAAAVPVFEGRRGHPAALSRRLFADLVALQGDQGARRLLDRLGSGLVEVATEDFGVVADIDTPADLARLTGQPAQREPRGSTQER